MLAAFDESLAKTHKLGDLVVLAWNCNRILHGSRELDLVNLLTATAADIACLSETEIPAESAPFAVDGYSTFYPLLKKGAKARVLILVKNELAVRANARVEATLMTTEFPSVWIRLDAHLVRGGGHDHLHGAALLGAVYRQWGSANGESRELEILMSQIAQASKVSKRIILSGDFNLDSGRKYGVKYRHKTQLGNLLRATEKAGLKYHATPTTWRSYGLHKDGPDPDPNGAHRESIIDHVYTAGVHAAIEVLNDASSDHRPIVANISANSVASGRKLVAIKR
jgi:exonuclease III